MFENRNGSALDDRERSVAQRKLILEGIFATGQENVSGGVILLVYALALGANTFQVGLISTAGMIGAALQLIADRLLSLLGSRKRVACSAMGLLGIGRLVIALIPFATMWVAAQYLAWGLLAGLVLISGVAQVIEVIRLSWISGIVPEGQRGRFLGERQLIVQLIGSVIAICAAAFLDWQRGIEAARGLQICQVYYSIAALLALGSILTFFIVPEPPLRVTNGNGGWHLVGAPFKNDIFRPLILYHMSWNFFVGFAAPFFNLYLIQVLQMPLSVVAFYNFYAQIVSLYCVRLWGRLVDRFGSSPVIRMGVIGKALFPLSWLLLWQPSGWYTMPVLYTLTTIVHTANAFNTALAISTTNLALKLMPQSENTSYLATFRTVGNWIHAISPALGGLLATALQSAGWTAQVSILLLFAFSSCGRLFSLWVLRFVKEPGARSLRHTLRALSRVRGFSFSHGWLAWLRFWGGPIFAGFSVLRVRTGRFAATWRGSWFVSDDE
jgi:MFS family permease